jgi:3-oxoacyl-[acyl-carrier-protein] synthase II
MTPRRVVITGVGVVSAFGCDPAVFWRSLTDGTSGVRPVAVEGVEDGPVVGAPATGFTPRAHVDAKSLRLMAPAVAFGVAAAQLAMTDAAMPPGAVEASRLGAFVGSRGHSSDRLDLMTAVRRATVDGVFRLDVYGTAGLPLVHPMWLLKGLANNVLYFVSLKYDAQGMNNNISMGGVGATMAIGEAFQAVQRGYLDAAIAGGYDSGLDLDRVEMFRVSPLLSQNPDPATASRPFDGRRDGFVSGEGAGFLVLEPLDAARARGARIYGEVLGYGSALSPLSAGGLGPSARGFELAMRGAMADAGRDRPDAIFAHGLATPASDAEETRAIHQVFGADAARIPAPALKSMIGNTFAASGALEAVAALHALADNVLPPTINLTAPDPACDLDYVPGTTARPVALSTVLLSNAHLGGAHAALVLGRVDPA